MDRTNDRISEYLVPHLKEYIFDELSYDYLEKAGIMDIMKDVPVPINLKDMEGLTVLKIAKNMAFVIGCDPSFEYKDNYVQYILRNFDERFSDALVSEGLEVVEQHDYDYACILFRAAMLINPDNPNAYYCYGRACKDSYELGEDEEYVGRYKAEALEAFEVTTIKNPSFADAFYFLGYAYLNMGLYIKTRLTFEEYVRLVNVELSDEKLNPSKRAEMNDTLREIQERLTYLDEPCKIEEGYNLILTSKYEEGIKVLEKYKESSFNTWWPLWYYLGIAYMGIGEDHENDVSKVDEIAVTSYEEAIKDFKEVLKLSPSNDEVIGKLVLLYEKIGDIENKEKYGKKLEVVKANHIEDKKLAEENKLKEMTATKLN